jgi:hypothetical protein
MAIKTFTDNTTLPASDINTYLTNSGLVYITTATASATAAFLNITSCFSSTYDNYRITLTNCYSSSTANIGFQMLSGTTPLTTANYSWGLTGLSTIGASTNTFSNSGTRASILDSYFASVNGAATYDCLKPFLAAQTVFMGNSNALNAGANAYDMKSGVMIVENTVSYDGLRIVAAAGNISCVATIFGYRKV